MSLETLFIHIFCFLFYNFTSNGRGSRPFPRQATADAGERVDSRGGFSKAERDEPNRSQEGRHPDSRQARAAWDADAPHLTAPRPADLREEQK